MTGIQNAELDFLTTNFHWDTLTIFIDNFISGLPKGVYVYYSIVKLNIANLIKLAIETKRVLTSILQTSPKVENTFFSYSFIFHHQFKIILHLKIKFGVCD